MAQPGERVLIKTAEHQHEGLLIASHDDDVYLIKLPTGYNVGVKKKDVMSMQVLESAQELAQEDDSVLKKNSALPTIAILHTGGTIASKVDYKTGGVIPRFTTQGLLAQIPELKDIVNVESQAVAQILSGNLRFAHIIRLAQSLQEVIDRGVKGIIVGVGTDNLAAVAAGLAFMIEKCPIPIILVGSQRSSDRGSADANVNLLSAARFIAQTDFAGVAICMHQSVHDTSCVILPATKTYKLHTSRRDAFTPVNSSALFSISYPQGEIKTLVQSYLTSQEGLSMKIGLEDKVGLLKIHPNMRPEQFLVYKGYKGLVLEGTGMGHAPTGHVDEDTKIHTGILAAIKEVVDSGCVVVMVSQCMFGRANLHVYSYGRDLLSVGVVGGEDMLANTAFVKLAWLLAHYPQEKVKELITKNLRGEISQSLPYEEGFVDEKN